MQGKLDADHERMLALIDAYFALPRAERKLYQLARRRGLVSAPRDMERIPAAEKKVMERVCQNTETEAEWNALINELMTAYI